MIIGIGSDIVDVTRIEEALARHGERFLERVFSREERERAMASPHPAASLAKRWAAKEACAKALGCGVRDGVRLRDMIVTNEAGAGKPCLTLVGGAAQRLADLQSADLLPAGQCAVLHLSLSDDGNMALAFVVIEGVEGQ